LTNPFNYKRRNSSVVHIGSIPLGGNNPIRVQSMVSVSTMDTEACVCQAIEITEAGGEYVRLTAQGVREAENLRNIKNGLRALGNQVPLIADIHFNRHAAEVSAEIVEKVRINPGNFVDSPKKFSTDYSETEYFRGQEKICKAFVPFLNNCKKNNTAIRIGVNHGSLSDRIMSRYGDTPQGMVESCLEFLRICKEENFSDVVISIKASNTSVMVRTVRLLVDEMEKEGLDFPLHLGVTEAGEGEDGRIKSAVGIGALLIDGIGDTIRVSLSENPANEIPVAIFIRNYSQKRKNRPLIREKVSTFYNSVSPERRKTTSILNIGGNNLPVVIVDYSSGIDFSENDTFTPDFVYTGKAQIKTISDKQKRIVDYSSSSLKENEFPLFTLEERDQWESYVEGLDFIRLSYEKLDEDIIRALRKKTQTVILLDSPSSNKIGENRAFIHRLMNEGIENPVVLLDEYDESDSEIFRMKSAIDAGSFFLDMLVDGLFLRNKNKQITSPEIRFCAFGILQATGRRISKTEYISCPGCGRTLFDLQTSIHKIKRATSHLIGLKIAVMGCIVNGPGEMADADYGYVGAGKGKISLYKGKECLEKNIPEEKAVEKLLEIIKKG
jgi:1-hydroxy-2-methyl-2-(E)-butenyl 4-diphosphate synthase